MECLIKYMEERKLPTGLRQRIRQYSSMLLNGLTPGASPPKGTGPPLAHLHRDWLCTVSRSTLLLMICCCDRAARKEGCVRLRKMTLACTGRRAQRRYYRFYLGQKTALDDNRILEKLSPSLREEARFAL